MGHEHGRAAGQARQEEVAVLDLEAEFYKLHFDVQRSIRYHQRRRRWYDGLHNLAAGAGALFGSVAFFTILQQQEMLAMMAAAIVTLLSVSDLVLGSSGMARLHHDLARDFIALDARIRTENQTGKLYKSLCQERLSIEANEPPTHVILNRICYNEQLRAEGRHEEGHLIELTWFQRALAHVMDIGAHTSSRKKMDNQVT